MSASTTFPTFKIQPPVGLMTKKRVAKTAAMFRPALVAAGVPKKTAFGLSFKCAKAFLGHGVHVIGGFHSVKDVLSDQGLTAGVHTGTCPCGMSGCTMTLGMTITGPAGSIFFH